MADQTISMLKKFNLHDKRLIKVIKCFSSVVHSHGLKIFLLYKSLSDSIAEKDSIHLTTFQF